MTSAQAARPEGHANSDEPCAVIIKSSAFGALRVSRPLICWHMARHSGPWPEMLLLLRLLHFLSMPVFL